MTACGTRSARNNIVITSFPDKGLPSMRVNLIKIGNSRGIIIPSSLIAACDLKDAVELQVEDGKIILEPHTQLRSGWFDNYSPEKADDTALDAIALDEDTAEWNW